MENGAISDGQITASSEWSVNHAAIQGRLNFLKSGVKEGAWVVRYNNGDQWLQIDLGRKMRVTGVATQGRNGFDHWVTKYNLQYSDYDNEVHFSYYIEPGQNENKVTLKLACYYDSLNVRIRKA